MYMNSLTTQRTILCFYVEVEKKRREEKRKKKKKVNRFTMNVRSTNTQQRKHYKYQNANIVHE